MQKHPTLNLRIHSISEPEHVLGDCVVEAKTNILPNLPFLGDWARSGIDMIQSVAE